LCDRPRSWSARPRAQAISVQPGNSETIRKLVEEHKARASSLPRISGR